MLGRESCWCTYHILQRAQHKRQWSAEFVAHVAEEGRLGRINFSQGLCPPALFLVRVRVGDCTSDLIYCELNKVAISMIELEPRTNSGNEKTVGSALPGTSQRRDDRTVRRLGPAATREPPKAICKIRKLAAMARLLGLGQR